MRSSHASQQPYRRTTILKTFFVWGALLGGIAPTISCQSCGAQETRLDATALSLAPKDAAFFSTSIGLRKSCEEFFDSKLMKRLLVVPYVQNLIEEFRTEWESPTGPMAQAKGALENPTSRAVIDLAIAMVSFCRRKPMTVVGSRS